MRVNVRYINIRLLLYIVSLASMLGFLSALPNKVQRQTKGQRTGYGSINNYSPTTTLWVLENYII